MIYITGAEGDQRREYESSRTWIEIWRTKIGRSKINGRTLQMRKKHRKQGREQGELRTITVLGMINFHWTWSHPCSETDVNNLQCPTWVLRRVISLPFEKEPTEETSLALKIIRAEIFKAYSPRPRVEIKVIESLVLHSQFLETLVKHSEEFD